MWGYVSSVTAKPLDTKVDDYDIALEVWEADNFKTMT